ncbi:MAG: hypothetical protein R3200_06390 [Xanthomonadales bacterium]|nr:hypothetical protein [Xanthomonadales bacterium]
MDKLRRLRDELRVQIHLAGAEARDEWHALEKRWRELNRRIADAEGDTGIAATLHYAAEELHRGYVAVQSKLRKR